MKSKPSKSSKPSKPYKPYKFNPIEISCPNGVAKPTVPKGWSTWVEWGTWYKARTVDPKKFYGHRYQGGYEKGIGECICGCYMGDCSSSGEVDPFGACPHRPRKSK